MTPLARPASVAIQILRLPQVRARTGLCRTMIYQLEAGRQFPRRVKIGVRAVGWIEGAVEEWLTQRVECSRSVPNPFAYTWALRDYRVSSRAHASSAARISFKYP